jgi:hypothetical protein
MGFVGELRRTMMQHLFKVTPQSHLHMIPSGLNGIEEEKAKG